MRNLPIAQVVCWVCKRGDVTLYRLRDKYGFKTPDYACNTDRLVGLPKQPNQSLIPFPTREEMEQLKKLFLEREGQDEGSLPSLHPITQG
jgi:hypothetical protein